MQVVIPMSGFGERFRAVGYTIPKWMIEVEGKSIIQHVVELFPGETDFLFICNQDHLDDENMNVKGLLRKICVEGKIIGINPHRLGPVHAILAASTQINPLKPVLVNYCDFSCYWDWSHFKRFVKISKCAGAIPSYRGFHPHSLGSTNYAYLKLENGRVAQVREKESFTDDRMNEYASSGSYYFANGKIMIDSFNELIRRKLQVGGEYYVSLAYNILREMGMAIEVYPLRHFMQWGTPQDLNEYLYWSNMFRLLSDRNQPADNPRSNLIMPMAGLGTRFVDAGYKRSKPLIEVSGTPMVQQAINDLPARNTVFLVERNPESDFSKIRDNIFKKFSAGFSLVLDQPTAGQACTVLAAVESPEWKARMHVPVTVGACDCGVLFNEDLFSEINDNEDVDVIVWAIRGYPNAVRFPEMYGWIDETEGKIRSISVKTPLSKPQEDPIVTGIFSFKNSEVLKRSIQEMIGNDDKINGEFYLDSCVNHAVRLGYDCRIFEIESFMCWGTPNDLKTFQYWQSCFDKWHSHPYMLEKDVRVQKASLSTLRKNYRDQP